MKKIMSFETQEFERALKACFEELNRPGTHVFDKLKKPGTNVPKKYAPIVACVFTLGWNAHHKFTRTVLDIVSAYNVRIKIVKERKKK